MDLWFGGVWYWDILLWNIIQRHNFFQSFTSIGRVDLVNIWLTLILNWLLVESPKVKSRVAVSVHVQDMSIYAKSRVIRVLLYPNLTNSYHVFQHLSHINKGNSHSCQLMKRWQCAQWSSSIKYTKWSIVSLLRIQKSQLLEGS